MVKVSKVDAIKAAIKAAGKDATVEGVIKDLAKQKPPIKASTAWVTRFINNPNAKVKKTKKGKKKVAQNIAAASGGNVSVREALAVLNNFFSQF